MRVVLIALVIAVVVACGGGSKTSPGPTTATPVPAGNGQVDCVKVKAAAQELLSIQFLAQLKTADTIEQIKTKQIGNLDLDRFLAAMHDLHALDGYTSPLGDPKAAIDIYEGAGQAAQVLFATDPMTQAAIDTYDLKVGTVADFLGHQVAIAGALDTAGC